MESYIRPRDRAVWCTNIMFGEQGGMECHEHEFRVNYVKTNELIYKVYYNSNYAKNCIIPESMERP